MRTGALAVLEATLALPVDISYHLTIATHHLFFPKYNLEIREVYMISTNLEIGNSLHRLYLAWHIA